MFWLFDTASFIPRADCGNWPDWLIIQAMSSDLLIWLSYFAIPVTLFYLYHQRKSERATSWVILLFVAFIFSCGITHLLDACMYYWPAYRLLILSKMITAVISLITALLLPKSVRDGLARPSVAELQQSNNLLEAEVTRRKEIETNVRAANHELANQVQILQNRLQLQGWIAEKQVDLDKMKSIVTDLRKSYAGPDKTTS